MAAIMPVQLYNYVSTTSFRDEYSFTCPYRHDIAGSENQGIS